MFGISWLLIALSLFSAFVGLRHLKAHKQRPDSIRLLFARFCLLISLYQIFQGLLYQTRELKFAFFLVLGSYFAFLLSQLSLVYFIHWFTKKTLPRILVLIATLAVGFLSVITILTAFFASLSEHIYFRNALFPGFSRTIFYDFEPGLLFNLDVTLAFCFTGICFLPLLWHCHKSGRGIFSRIPFMWALILLILVHDFAAANRIFESTYLYEIVVTVFIYIFSKDLCRESHPREESVIMA